MNRQTSERPRTEENSLQGISFTPYEQDDTLRRVVVTRSKRDENGDPIMESGGMTQDMGIATQTARKRKSFAARNLYAMRMVKYTP